MSENETEKDGKDKTLSSDGNPNDAKQNWSQGWSNPQNKHHSSTDSHPSQRRRKISVVESSDAVFAERRKIRVFHKKFGESMLSENSRLFNKKLQNVFICIRFRSDICKGNTVGN